jgi:hypothetical protein
VRVTRERAAAHREKILGVPGTLFRQHGFDGIGVADIGCSHGHDRKGFVEGRIAPRIMPLVDKPPDSALTRSSIALCGPGVSVGQSELRGGSG